MEPMKCNFAPYWGPVSSNVDWCEPNYVHTGYVCEFWNTLSNIPMIFLGLFGVLSFWKANLQIRFLLSGFFLFLVGVGSTLFHATLLYHYQLLDELPMILGSLVFVFCLADMRKLNEKLHPLRTNIIMVVLIIYAVLTSVFMAADTSSPVPMNVSYILMVHYLVLRAAWMFYQANDAVLRKYFILSLVCYMTGAVCWICEKSLCGVYGVTIYLHAIWHILAGFGTYIFVTWMAFVQAQNLGKNPSMKIRWFLIPYVSIAQKML